MGRFYTRHIEEKAEARRKAGKKRIRIAILDTGINENDLYISPILGDIKAKRREQYQTQLRAERDKENSSRPRRCATPADFGPIRMKKSFVVANGIAEDTLDTCGHGTHIAGLLLKVAPDTDIYVAKVACDIQFENIDPVVKVS